MKYLVVLAMLISPTVYAKSQLKDRVKFIRGQVVRFQPPKFYSKVCSGKAEVWDAYSQNNRIVYVIRTLDNPHPDCPSLFESPENELEAWKE